MTPKRKHDPGYKLPEVIDPDTCCVCIPLPNDFNHKMAFLGQLDELGYWWNWERDPDKKGREAAAVWRNIVQCIREDLDMSGCGCGEDKPTNTRINPETGLYEVSYDGGVTWQPAPEQDPRNSGTVFPPRPGDPGDVLRCQTANSVVGFFEERKQEEYEGLVANATFAAFVTDLLAALAAIGLAFALVPTAIAALLAFVVNGFARAIPEDFDSQFTNATWEALLCVVYCHCEPDGSFTEAQWQAIKTEARDMIGGYAGQWAYDHLNLIGVVGLTNAGRANYPGSRECDDCGCAANCEDNVFAGIDESDMDHGTVVSRNGDGTVTFELATSGPATGYLIIRFPSLGNCCYVNSFTQDSGASAGVAFIPCGLPYDEGNYTVATPVGQCVQYAQWQGAAGAIITVTFSECP